MIIFKKKAEVSLKDMELFQKAFCMGNRKLELVSRLSKGIMIVFAAADYFIAAMAAYYCISAGEEVDYLTLVMLLFIGTFMLLYGLMFNKLRARSALRILKRGGGVSDSAIFMDDCVAMDTKISTTTYYYTAMDRLFKTPDCYFLFMGKQGIIVPKANLYEGTLQEFEALLSSRTGLHFKTIE